MSPESNLTESTITEAVDLKVEMGRIWSPIKGEKLTYRYASLISLRSWKELSENDWIFESKKTPPGSIWRDQERLKFLHIQLSLVSNYQSGNTCSITGLTILHMEVGLNYKLN